MDVLFAFVFSSILLTLTPGPDLLMVVSHSLEKGFFSAIQFIFGLATGLFAHTLLLVLGWAQFIGERPHLVDYIQLIACVYFSFLGVQSIRSFFQNSRRQKTVQAMDKPYYQGVIMNVLNPKVSLFFWMFFPGFLFHPTLATATQYAVLGVIFLVQAIIIFSLVASFASRATFFSKHRYTPLFTGVLWIGLGLYMVLT